MKRELSIQDKFQEPCKARKREDGVPISIDNPMLSSNSKYSKQQALIKHQLRAPPLAQGIGEHAPTGSSVHNSPVSTGAHTVGLCLLLLLCPDWQRPASFLYEGPNSKHFSLPAMQFLL